MSSDTVKLSSKKLNNLQGGKNREEKQKKKRDKQKIK